MTVLGNYMFQALLAIFMYKGIIFKLFEELFLIINCKLIPVLTGSMLTAYGLSAAHCSELLSHSVYLKHV